MATRKQPFPPEPDTQPDLTRKSGRAPKSKRDGSLPPTVPPPKVKRGRGSAEHKASYTRSKRPAAKGGRPGATVDEVTADLSRDPRREKE